MKITCAKKQPVCKATHVILYKTKQKITLDIKIIENTYILQSIS